VLAGPLGADVGRSVETGHPVDERAATHARAGEQGDRAIPGRQQAVVQVQPAVGVELVAGHRRLVDEWPGFKDEHGPTGAGQLRRHHARAGTCTDDDDVRLELDVRAAGGRGPTIDHQGRDRSEVPRDRRLVGRVADGDRQRIRRVGRSRVRVGDEREQLPEGVDAGATKDER